MSFYVSKTLVQQSLFILEDLRNTNCFLPTAEHSSVLILKPTGTFGKVFKH